MNIDFFGQELNIGDRVLVSTGDWPRAFRVSTIIRFTPKSVVISRPGMPKNKKPLYAKSVEMIKMTDELEKLYTMKVLSE